MRHLLFFLAILFSGIALFGQAAEVVYVEGTADIRDAGGGRYQANFGDPLSNGDSIITGYDGFLELQQADESSVRISADTVFTVRQIVDDGGENTVYSTEVGSAFFRFRTMVGREPRIATPSSVAGVRGTSFSVYAGADGSSLYIVEEGQVDVSAAGATVSLVAGEAVEVHIGDQPGETFEVMRGSLDYSNWNAGRLEAVQRDPVAAIHGVARRMDDLIGSVRQEVLEYEALQAQIREEREKLDGIEESDGLEARQNHYRDVIFPLEVDSGFRYLNLRYYALSALSLRRYVMTGIYIRILPSYGEIDAEIAEFIRIYRETEATFESEVTPYLVDADF